MPLILCCIAALALAYGLSDYTGIFLWSSIPPIALCVIASVAAAWLKRDNESGARFDAARVTSWLLLASVIVSLGWMILFRLETDYPLPARPWLQRVHSLALGGVLLHFFGPKKAKPIVFASLVVLFAIAAELTIEAHPRPPIDTWYFQQAGANGLLHGENPYELAYETPYNEWEAAVFYGPNVLQNGYLMSYTYPPLNVLVEVPFFAILGDIRYSLLVAVGLSALLIRWLAPPDHRTVAELSALFLLFSPVTLFVVRQAWTEPLVFALWLAVLVTTRRAIERKKEDSYHRWQLGIAITLGLLIVIKQYTVLVFVPPLLLAAFRDHRRRQIVAATAVIAAVCLPFFIWHPLEFMRDVVLTQFWQPFRLDALSVLAVIARLKQIPTLPSYTLLPAFLVPILVYILRRPSPDRLDQITRTTAAGFLLFIFLNKQAFCNYYWLALGILCASCACNDSTGNERAIPTS